MKTRFILACAIAGVLQGLPAAAQVAPGWDPGAPLATRAELEELAGRLESTSRSETYSAPIREQAAASAAEARRRLTDGDFRPGDAVMLQVQGAPHDKLTAGYSVDAQTGIIVPGIGQIPLKGVLRSEVQAVVEAELTKKIKGFTVNVQLPVRVEVAGAVMKPGSYMVPVTVTLSDLLTSPNAGGGTQPEAMASGVRVMRDGEVVVEGRQISELASGNPTLAQLGVRNGDIVDVPLRTQGILSRGRSLLGAVSGIASILMLVSRLGS